MNLSLSLPAPIVLTIGDKQYSIPKFSMQDFIQWGAELDAIRREDACQGLTGPERFKVLSFYVIAPTDFGELSGLVRSPAGTKRVIETCLPRGGVEAEMVKSLLENGDRLELAALARALAGIPDPSPESSESGEDTLATEGQGSDPTRPSGAASAG